MLSGVHKPLLDDFPPRERLVERRDLHVVGARTDDVHDELPS